MKNRAYWRVGQELELAQSRRRTRMTHLMLLYGVRSPGPGSDIVGDVVEWFATRAEAERFIAEVAGEPNPEDAVLANRLSFVEVDFAQSAEPSLS